LGSHIQLLNATYNIPTSITSQSITSSSQFIASSPQILTYSHTHIYINSNIEKHQHLHYNK
jgi:hypothetical protein